MELDPAARVVQILHHQLGLRHGLPATVARLPVAYSDGVLTWPLIVPRGLVIFDDYQWGIMPAKLENPKPGVDAFLKAFRDQGLSRVSRVA